MPKGMQAIFTQVASGSASNIIFNNIPQNYTDLMILMSTRDQVTGTGTYILPVFNNNSTAVYSQTNVYQSITDYGTSVLGLRNTNTTYFGLARLACNSSGSYWTSNMFSTIKILIPEYTTSKFKQITFDVTAPNMTTNAYGISTGGGLFKANSPITRIDLPAPANYVAGSTFTLYGISR